MDIDRILTPFRPFSIVTASGRSHLVTHPEHMAVDPDRRVLAVDEGTMAIIDVHDVTRVIAHYWIVHVR
jgi:hypothetical protein